jgi:hypothetical protein
MKTIIVALVLIGSLWVVFFRSDFFGNLFNIK